MSTVGVASSSDSMVVGTGITAYGKGGSFSLSSGSGGAINLIVGSSMINEGVSMRMLAGSILSSDMTGGFSIVSVGPSETCIGENL